MSLPMEKLQRLIQSKMTGFLIDDKGNKTEHGVRIDSDGSAIFSPPTEQSRTIVSVGLCWELKSEEVKEGEGDRNDNT